MTLSLVRLDPVESFGEERHATIGDFRAMRATDECASPLSSLGKKELLGCRPLLRAGNLHVLLVTPPALAEEGPSRLRIMKVANQA